jgi:hypothetical protein
VANNTLACDDLTVNPRLDPPDSSIFHGKRGFQVLR